MAQRETSTGQDGDKPRETKSSEKAKSLQEARADAEQPAGEFEISHDGALADLGTSHR